MSRKPNSPDNGRRNDVDVSNGLDPGRRRFLGRLGLAMGGTALLGLQGRFGLIPSALAAPGDYSTYSDYLSLVCVFLYGGMDIWNLRVPTGLTEYQRYANVRQNLAIDRNSLLPIAGLGQGWHPSVPGLSDLYAQGKLAVVTNVGNLFAPISRDQYFDHIEGQTLLSDLPPDLFSHSHQTETFQTSYASSPGVSHPGWGGRIGDLMGYGNGNLSLPPSFSLDGNNHWQAGEQYQPYAVRPQFDGETGKLRVDNFNHFAGDTWPPSEQGRTAAWQQIIDLHYTDPLQDQAAMAILASKDRADQVRNILASAPDLSTPYNVQNRLAQQLHGVAQLINVREALGLQRQLFFVGLGGWDTHGNHVNDHGNRLADLDDALSSFQQTLTEMGVEDSVTTFTASEFNRTFTSNGDGTDHAWASECLVMGGAVDGGKIHGQPIAYSDVPEGTHWGQSLFGPDDVGSGRFIPQYSTDQYGATLARWLGVAEDDLAAIFPHLDNFALKDLGFML